jgi:hypothetical protein
MPRCRSDKFTGASSLMHRDCCRLPFHVEAPNGENAMLHSSGWAKSWPS